MHFNLQHKLFLFILLICYIPCAYTGTNFAQCLQDFQSGKFGTLGGTDTQGKPVNNTADAAGIKYEYCVQYCGPGQEEFIWSVFSQQFSSWLLPWLALVSQLPFGAHSQLDNLISVVLTLGSPTLAGYSLALTVINSRWVHHKFETIKYPNRHNAAKALASLQQLPLQVTSTDGLLASLIVLPENDQWWADLVERLDFSYSWSIATATNIAWVAIAFLFTVVDSFINVGLNINSTGQGVGSLWLWLLPLVIGWLKVPINSNRKLVSALNRANDIAYVASPVVDDELAPGGAPSTTDKPYLAKNEFDDRGILVEARRGAVYRDEKRSAPIFNYARFLGWVDAVEQIAEAFEHASERARKRQTVKPKAKWIVAHSGQEINPANRTGNIVEVQEYCGYSSLHVEEEKKMWRDGVLSRIFIASTFALFLQWGTTTAASLIVIFTPTVGLGCRSGAYILYGIFSTVVWAMLLTSSILNHYCTVSGCPSTSDSPRGHRSRLNSNSIAAVFSLSLRRTAVFIASMNSIWIVAVCIFQFSSVFDTCYCNSSVVGLGWDQAYNVIQLSSVDLGAIKGAWAGSVVLAGGCVVIYTSFVSLMVDDK